MKLRMIGPLAGLLMFLAVPVAHAGVATVTIRVEGQKKTLVPERSLTTTKTAFSKDGVAAHSCPGTSAGGALQQATHGKFKAKYSDGLGYFISSIEGETHPGSPDFWSFWVNHKQASAGACATELKRGDDALFFVDRCVYDTKTMACKNKPYLPLGLRVAHRVKVGQAVTAKVVIYSPSGKATVVRGATVYSGKHALGTTNAKGKVTFRLKKKGAPVLVAAKKGAVKSEPETVQVKKAA
jgi:hypothetical protein